jgi:hypothetical protein
MGPFGEQITPLLLANQVMNQLGRRLSLYQWARIVGGGSGHGPWRVHPAPPLGEQRRAAVDGDGVRKWKI